VATFLFDKIVFGPVNSRRLGVSLGMNLSPIHKKVCNFDCIYCECGLNTEGNKVNEQLTNKAMVYEALHGKLKKKKNLGEVPDVITFAGNGEPTMHPDFAGIIDDTVVLRNTFFPTAKISVLSSMDKSSKIGT
jgi:wyosine [tRNA(Phe)-imidazoG37] synthetase (radical SAM superfamily)